MMWRALIRIKIYDFENEWRSDFKHDELKVGTSVVISYSFVNGVLTSPQRARFFANTRPQTDIRAEVAVAEIGWKH